MFAVGGGGVVRWGGRDGVGLGERAPRNANYPPQIIERESANCIVSKKGNFNGNWDVSASRVGILAELVAMTSMVVLSPDTAALLPTDRERNVRMATLY